MAVGEAFSFIARRRLDEAVAAFQSQTGMIASVYVGSTDGSKGEDLDADGFADRALRQLPVHEAGTVLLVVDPARRVSVIRTDAVARHRITDESCALATLSMTTSFGAGDLVGGIVVGLRMLGDATAPPRPETGRPSPTSSTVTRR